MKLKTFWKSICALVLALLIVMAVFRGPQSQWLMIGVFRVWVVFIAVSLVKSLLSGAGYALGAFLVKEARGVKGNSNDVSLLIVENRELKIALMNQIILRITENLNDAYPDAAWKWKDKNPLERILNQESCRIAISNVPEFNFADILINAKGELDFEFGKKVTLKELKRTAKEEKSEPEGSHEIDDWFNAEGNKLLSNLVCELNAAGYSKFFIGENGEISILDEGRLQVLETDFRIPAGNLARLKDLLKTARLNSEIDGDKLAVSV